MKRVLLLLLPMLLLTAACAADESPSPSPEPSPGGSDNIGGNDTMQNPIVTITMDDGSVIRLELYPDKAPNTVANFVTLAQSGYYDGLIFHRTSPSFMIQGGCPDGNGGGNPGYSIKGEFAENGFAQNDLKHERGVISMARSRHNDSAGSQFFICVVDYPSLDNLYAAFGRVIEGIETADSIASGPNTGGLEMRALEPRTMTAVTVETFGVEYKAETIR